jgi:hypothetical protein
MSDMRDFYYLQVVCQDELDGALSALEAALWNFAMDQGQAVEAANRATRGGAISGWTASLQGVGQAINFTAGWGYDEDGKRIKTPSTLQVTITADGRTTAGSAGIPNGNSIAPALLNHRYVSVYLAHDRVLSSPRLDGFGSTINFVKTESFYFQVAAGAEVTIASGAPPLPARRTDAILLGDFLLANSGSVTCTAFDQDRMEWWLNATGAGSAAKALKAGEARTAFETLLDYYSNHVSDVADKHAASSISFSTTETWANGDTAVSGATTVSAALETMIQELADSTGVAGADRIGVAAQAGAGLGTTGGGAPPTASAIAAGTLETALEALLDAVNSRVNRGGDNGISGALIPSAAGVALGAGGFGWDLYLRNLKGCSSVECSLVPSTNSHSLGTAANPWSKVAAEALYGDAAADIVAAYAHIVPSAANTYNLGTEAAPWAEMGTGLLYGDTIADTVKVGAHLQPLTDGGRTLGLSNRRWLEMHAVDSITVNPPQVTVPLQERVVIEATDFPYIGIGVAQWVLGETSGTGLDRPHLVRSGIIGAETQRSRIVQLPEGSTIKSLELAMYTQAAVLADRYKVHVHAVTKGSEAVATKVAEYSASAWTATTYLVKPSGTLGSPHTVDNVTYYYVIGFECLLPEAGPAPPATLENAADKFYHAAIVCETTTIR